jgi:4-hydroxybenzoate polyprenyltransferase
VNLSAHQDTRDDAVIGVRSTARLFGAWTKPVLIGFAALTAALLAAALALAGAGPLAYAGLALFAGHLGWQVRTLDAARPAVCLMLFKSNRHAGWLLFAGIIADGTVRYGLA